jgi:hypothetical protein
MIARANPEEKDMCKKLWEEANQLTMIFSKITVSCNRNNLK